MSNKPRLGSESFWEMAALAMAGLLASCQSCVEHFYFQSKQNSDAFLDTCAEGGLVEKVSLLDLLGDLGPRPNPTMRQMWYDQPIYISAPTFRRKYLDAARERIENTKNAVYNAFRLYHEALGADDAAIDSAYVKALQDKKLRHSDTAQQRQDVDLSPIAKLRLIQDGFRNSIKKENPALPREVVEQLVSESTAAYVLGFSGQDIVKTAVSDRAEELEKFIEEFLADQHDLKEFWRASFGEMPATYRLQILPVIGALVRRRYETLVHKNDSSRARQFIAHVKEKIGEAQDKVATPAYVSALSELMEDIDFYTSEYQSTMAATLTDPGIAAESLSR